MSQRSDLRQRRAALEGEWSRTVSLVKSTGSAPSSHEPLRHEDMTGRTAPGYPERLLDDPAVRARCSSDQNGS